MPRSSGRKSAESDVPKAYDDTEARSIAATLSEIGGGGDPDSVPRHEGYEKDARREEAEPEVDGVTRLNPEQAGENADPVQQGPDESKADQDTADAPKANPPKEPEKGGHARGDKSEKEK